MSVGTLGSGRIGLAVLRMLKPFNVRLHYTDRHRLPESIEKARERLTPARSRVFSHRVALTQLMRLLMSRVLTVSWPVSDQELGLTYHEDVHKMLPLLDVLTCNCPLHAETDDLIDAKAIGAMKRGAYIVNTARGKICNRDAVADALKSGHLAGYGGCVSGVIISRSH